MKEKLQTKTNKAKFYKANREFIDHLGSFEHKDIAHLCNDFGISNRMIRKKLSETAMFFPIVSLSTEKGYIRLGDFETLSVEEQEKYVEMVRHQINDYKSRIAFLNRRMKPLIAWVKMVEKKNND